MKIPAWVYGIAASMPLLLVCLMCIATRANAQQPAQLSVAEYQEIIATLANRAAQLRFERDQLQQRGEMLTRQLADKAAEEARRNGPDHSLDAPKPWVPSTNGAPGP